MQPNNINEGHIKFHGCKTWYQIVGTQEASHKLPLLCLHGGPGVPHDYLDPLKLLTTTGRQVIFYDQLGCGNSGHPTDATLWTVDLFKDELNALIKELKIDQYHLLGQSWGGMLALEHALEQPSGLRSLILASTMASVPQWIAETNRLRHELPSAIQETLNKHEASCSTDSAEYAEAVMQFYNLHLCRLNPWPEELQRAFAKIALPVYQTMWGPNEFTATGILKDWDVRHRLNEIKVPTLITAGKYDEATPLITNTLHQGIINSQMVIFENSAHLSHLEEFDRYVQILSEFLNTIEKSLLPQ